MATSTPHPTPPPPHAAPFPYEDTLERSIQSVITLNNKHDSTGRLNALRIPPRRTQQALCRPKWYAPSLHAHTPRLSLSIRLSSETIIHDGEESRTPCLITAALTHVANPEGNPGERSVRFRLAGTPLGRAVAMAGWYPWLVLLHDEGALEGGLREVEAEEEEGHGPAVPWEGVSGAESAGEDDEKGKVDEGDGDGDGVVTLAVGESREWEVEFRPGPGVLAVGKRYSVCFRGCFVDGWEFGDGEVGGERLVVPVSNLVEVGVER